MPITPPYFFLEDRGGKEFWQKVISRYMHPVACVDWHFRHLPGLANLPHSAENIANFLRRTMSRNAQVLIFILDADVYIQRFSVDASEIDEIARRIHEKLSESLRQFNFQSTIKICPIQVCLESILCTDLEVIWRTRTPRPKTNVAFPNPLPEEFQGLLDSDRIHCPASLLVKFTKQFCEGPYHKKLHPGVYGREIDLEIIQHHPSVSNLFEWLRNTFQSH